MTLPLYAVVRWALGVLPVDKSGRRIFDETLADWRREAERSSGPLSGVVVSARAMFSVLRCVTGVSLREVALIGQSGVLARVFLWTVGYLVVANLIVQLSPNIWTLTLSSRLYRQVAFLAYFLPVAVLLATALGSKQRPAPSLGLGLSTLLVAAALLGWGVPLTNRAFLEANPGTSTARSGQVEIVPNPPGEGLRMASMGMWKTGPGPYLPTRLFMNDLTVTQLATRIVRGPEFDGWSAIRWTSFFFAYLVACALIPVLGTLLQRSNVLVRSAILATTVLLLWTQGELATPMGEFSIMWWLGACWIPVAWIGLCVVAATRRCETPKVFA